MGMLDIGASVADAVFSAWSADQKADNDAAQAQYGRDWQERMANTQYQRTVQDLNAAGLSPMLAYSKGATSMPSSSIAAGGATASSDFSGGVQKSAQRSLTETQIDVAKAQEMLNIQNAKKAAEEAKLTALRVEQMPTEFYYNLANIGSQINSNSANANRTNVQARNEGNLEAPGAGLPVVRDAKNLFRDVTGHNVSDVGRVAYDRFNNLAIDAKSWLDDRKNRIFDFKKGK